jgi:hypothetical protein
MSYKVLNKVFKTLISQKKNSQVLLAGLALSFGCVQTAVAVEGSTAKPLLWTDQEMTAQRQLDERANPAVEIRRSYALGVNRYALNHATRLIGWQVGESLYFGRAKGEDSGIALVWQRRWNQQVSLSNDGIRLTRHF